MEFNKIQMFCIILASILIGLLASTFFISETHAGCYYETKATGGWVCVNVGVLDYEQAVNVCRHEVGHEMFAQLCEDDIDKCFDVVKELEGQE